jgi:8-hydroxy-5-deazaflavin:NADPH oxidoreductase
VKEQTMKVAIIGAGNVGKALAGSAERAGHDVTLAAQHVEHAQEAATTTGATAAPSTTDAVRDADVVILAVPASALETVALEIGDELAGKAVVDVTNHPTPDPSAPSNESTAEVLQSRLPQARVVKAFNTAFASRQANPVIDGIAIDGYIAGDDPGAKKAVSELARSIGFRPVDVGPLLMARTLEAMAWLNINLQMQNNWPWQAGWKLVGPTGE